jgi:hypothetical protein
MKLTSPRFQFFDFPELDRQIAKIKEMRYSCRAATGPTMETILRRFWMTDGPSCARFQGLAASIFNKKFSLSQRHRNPGMG